MAYLLDTGVLLRYVDDRDAQHALVKGAVKRLRENQEDLFITSQNIAELWNVATRPVANNGFELPVADVDKLITTIIDPICNILIETAEFPNLLRRLLSEYSVIGKQVHDARLVAMMLAWQVDSILTLNERNFRRFEPEGISIVTPETIVTSSS